ncbi:MAG: T9SS type A sorting domain-containing protein [Candidatus Fermentibacteraceae bacterium]
MTGLEVKGTYLYLSSVNQNSCYRYDLPNVVNRITHRFYVGYSQTKDIAINADNNIWVAANHATNTLRLYNASNQVIDFIEPSMVPYATGVTMDPEGYLWVADPTNDKIYKIDLSTGVADESSAETQGFSIRAGSNPFVGAVTIFIEGTPTATVELFDIYGRMVATGTTTGHWIWDGTMNGTVAPSGTYLAMVRSEAGTVQTLNLIKL